MAAPGVINFQRNAVGDSETPKELLRYVQRLEDNVVRAIERIDRLFFPAFVPTERKVADYTAKIGEMVVMDTTSSSLTVFLPVSSAQNAGLAVAVIRYSNANTLTVKVAAGGKVNGVTSYNIPAVDVDGDATTDPNMRVFYSSGAGWYFHA